MYRRGMIALIDYASKKEIAVPGYERQDVIFNGNAKYFQNVEPVSWNLLPKKSITISGIAIYSERGHLLFQHPLHASKTVCAGDTFIFSVGSLSGSLSESVAHFFEELTPVQAIYVPIKEE